MYNKIRHSCFDLSYHLVLVTKYRHQIIKEELETKLKEYIYIYFENNKIEIAEYNSNLDHVHILFEGKPNMNLSHFINGLKTNSSKYIRSEFPSLIKKYYWKPYFWSNSYFIGGVSEKSTKIVKEYIKNQKE
jgi:putative transposase